jgi:hypothetical protein
LQVHGEFGDSGDVRWRGETGNDRVYVRRARVNLRGQFFEQFDFNLGRSYREMSFESDLLSCGIEAYTRFP